MCHLTVPLIPSLVHVEHKGSTAPWGYVPKPRQSWMNVLLENLPSLICNTCNLAKTVCLQILFSFFFFGASKVIKWGLRIMILDIYVYIFLADMCTNNCPSHACLVTVSLPYCLQGAPSVLLYQCSLSIKKIKK